MILHSILQGVKTVWSSRVDNEVDIVTDSDLLNPFTDIILVDLR
jgi:hypothetical protein